MKREFREIGRWLRVPFNRRHAFRRLTEFHSTKRSLDAVVGRAMSFGTKGKFRVKTTQIPSEINGLAAEVAKLQPKVIVEIGTYEGGTSLIWAQLASEQVITCDINPPGPRGELIRAFPPPGSGCKVSILTGDSHSADFAARVERELGGKKVDFLFIDGDHTEAGVEADYRTYSRLVREGGLIGFHDIADKQDQPGNEVQHFWKRLKQEAVTEEIIEDRDQTGFGIGIVRV
jgi:predicted O-methyltransferase YrrM